MDELRPKPKYGEYATPEEQRARIAEPLAPLGEPVSYPSREAADEMSSASEVQPVGHGRLHGASRRIDAVVTTAFLVYGLATLLTSLRDFMDIPGVINRGYLSMVTRGLIASAPAFQSTVAANLVGIGLAALWSAVWVAAVAYSWVRVRAGRLAFWVPLVAGVLANLVLAVAILVLLLTDPSWGPLLTRFGLD